MITLRRRKKLRIDPNPAVLDIPDVEVHNAWANTHIWCLAMEVV